MPIIRIATIRKSGYTDYALHLLRNHDWFHSEAEGTMCFKPDMAMSDKKTKSLLDEYVETKRAVTGYSVPN